MSLLVLQLLYVHVLACLCIHIAMFLSIYLIRFNLLFLSFKSNSYCDFGLMCRLGSSHINMSTGQNLCKSIDSGGKEEEKMADTPPVKEGDTASTKVDDGQIPHKPAPGTLLGHHCAVMNVLSKDTQVLLRKHKYPFVCKRHFEEEKGSSQKKQQQQPPTVVSSTTDNNTPAVLPTKRKLIDFRNKVYVAPLTTVGNLPFRRIMKHYGADITCGEMALSDQLLSGKPSEWALLKRHPSEDIFGVQIAAGHVDQFTRVAEVLSNESNMNIDFVDLNLGCPIDLVCNKGAGACLMTRDKKLRGSLEGMLNVLKCPVTIKMRTGWSDSEPIAHVLQPKIQNWQIDGIAAFMVSSGDPRLHLLCMSW